MEQKSKYEIEIENFRKIFDDKKNMRIAIYGIGRRTATLLPGITDYNITGLLDRDKNNVGKELCDIKVIPIDNIEEKADLIIINSDPSNYEIIFKRISGKVTIPVYYADGRLACLSDKDKSYEQNEYWKSSYEELKDKIDQADIVSFDIFDTLIMRKIFSPEDVFRLLGEKVKAELKSDCNIADIRAQVAAKCGLSVIDDRHIWISCEKKKDKISGSLWKEYSSVVGKNAKCIHIGDNKIGDIENSTKYGINSYYVMSGKDMLMNSSLSELASYVNTVSDSICLGIVIAKLFNSPFALCSTNGKVSFDDSEIYGYCIYGPLLEKFLIWLYYNSRKDGIDKLLFFARDGYFLEKDYKIVSELLDDGYKQDWCYLPISRRLIYMASMENEEDFKIVVEFPYVGTFADYMKSRFEIAVTDTTAQYNDMHINAVGDSHNILKWIQPYKEKIMQEAKAERENYIKYLEIDGDMQKDLTYGTVDLGYYGTNQYYLQRLTNIKTKGYCFYACLSKDNVYMNDISVDTCFQYGDDYTAEKSLVRKKNMYIETFITAPQGMIRYIDNHGGIVCESDRKSQKYFHIKEKVNCGVVNFIRDYINIYKGVLAVNSEEYIKLMHDRKESLEDNLFYNMLNGMCDVSKDILKGFYFDNDFVGGKEIMVEI